MGYAVAVVLVAIAGLLRWSAPGLLAATPYLAFYPAVVAAAAFGGMGPGLLATFVSYLCVDLVFDTTPWRIDIADPVVLGRMAIFFAGGIGTSVVAGMQRAAQARERRQTRELAENRGRLAGIVDSAMDAIVSVDAQQRIVLFNATAERVFGCPAAEAIGQPLDRFIPPRYRSAHAAHVARFAEGGGSSRAMGQLGSLVALRADGEEFPIEASISQVEVGDETILTAIVRDITERARAEATLRQTAEELVRSNQDLEQFAYVASHDLQEPLRMVSGFLQLLSRRYKSQLDEKADQYIDYAVDGAARMSTLIQDLLAYSRVNTRGEPFRPTAAQQALDVATRNLAAILEESKAKITHDRLPMVRVDSAQLIQLFQNLVGNALKYRAADRVPEVHVAARRDGGSWVFSVRDNGIGFEQQYSDKIFLIFQRLHVRGKYPGTGIGLAICKRIVERHGGRIWAIAEPDKGATFSFTLPA